ncbi:hypothetical protein ACW9IT_08935 [Pseudomonas sp. SDO5511_1_S431]
MTPPQVAPLPFAPGGADQHIQMQPLGHSAVQGPAGVNAVHNHQVLMDLEKKMGDIFAPHETPENREELAAMVKDRASQLQQMGQTAADVERLLDKATRMDRVTLPVQGAIGSAPFAVASVILDKVPGVTAKAAESAPYTGFIAGSMSGAVDTVGNGMLSRATHDTFWLKAPASALEPVMQHAQAARNEETTGARAVQSAGAFQTFTLRNIARGLVAVAVTATKGPKAAATADTVLSSAGGMVAGAGYAGIMRKHDLQAHRAGPEYLFGRQDWKKQYETLRDCSPSRDPLLNGAKRVAKLPLDLATDTVKSLAGAVTGSSIAANGLALGGGFSLATMTRSAVKQAATQAGLPPAAVVAADHATNVGMSALTFGAYGATAVLSDKATEATVKMLQEEVPPKAMSAASAVGAGLNAGAKMAGDLLSSSLNGLGTLAGHMGAGTGAEMGANAVAGLANQFRQRPVRNNGPQGDSQA